MENTNVNRRDHGTWSKHLTVHQSIYIIPFPIKRTETIYVLRSTDIFVSYSNGRRRKSVSSHSFFSFVLLTTPLCIK